MNSCEYLNSGIIKEKTMQNEEIKAIEQYVEDVIAQKKKVVK
jgi:hypothetical protein